jgi:antitoxin PrlF
MPSATMTSEGQITLPVEVRNKLRLGAGSRVDFEEAPDGTWSIIAQDGDIRRLRGFLKSHSRGFIAPEDMDAVVADAVVEAHKESIR